MALPAHDVEHLAQRKPDHTVSQEANMTCVVLPKYALPPGYDHSHSDLLLRLHPGYPDVPPDMWWFDPPVKLPDGRFPVATDAMEHHLGRVWQRWSRHFNEGQWRSGIDTLESFLALIRKELERCAAKAA